LKFSRFDANFLYYEPSLGDRGTVECAIARKPSCCGRYAVWRGTATDFEWFGRFDLEAPK